MFHDLFVTSNSIYTHLKIMVHVLPLNMYMQLPLKSTAAVSVQLRAEFNLMYCSLSERWSQIFWKLSESWNHPRKYSTPERLPNRNENYTTHILVILVVFLPERNIKRKVQYACSSYSESIICSAVPHTHTQIIYIYIYTRMSVFFWVGEVIQQT